MKEFIATILVLIALFGIIIGCISCSNHKTEQTGDAKYNNGICEICGTPFHFTNATYEIYNGYRYVYACENEHIIICCKEQHAHGKER